MHLTDIVPVTYAYGSIESYRSRICDFFSLIGRLLAHYAALVSYKGEKSHVYLLALLFQDVKDSTVIIESRWKPSFGKRPER